MKLDITMTALSMPLPAVCALPVLLPTNAAPVAWPAAERTQVEPAPALPIAVMLAPAPRVHQVQIQSELGKAALVRVDGNNGTTGFNGSSITISSKRYTDGGSGVPPRGRPV